MRSKIDRLLYHEADLNIATHYTDGGGVSDHVFALAYLLGFYYAPRIPNLAERRLYTFAPPSAWPVFEHIIAGRIDENLITKIFLPCEQSHTQKLQCRLH